MRRDDARAILARYPDAVAGRRLYRRLRLARAGYDAIERLVPRSGLVVDLGAGEGLLAHVLVRAAPDRRVIAVDHHPGRVARLEASAKGLPLEARLGDFTAIELPPCDAVLLVDVLHYLDRPGQEALLHRAAEALRPGGVVLLRDPDAGAGWKFAWNRLHELAATTLGLTRATIGAYRTGGSWVGLLSDLGLADARAERRRLLTPYADRVVTAVRGPALPERSALPGLRVPVAPPSAAFGPPCLLCGAHGRHEVLVHPQGRLTRCRSCGLASVDPLPSSEAALAGYDAAYFGGTSGYRDYAAEEANFRREFRRRLPRIRAAGGRGRLLDVGAATGAFLAEARAHGFAVTGVEPTDAVARLARERGLDVRTSPVESAALPAHAFDVVTMFDALEHVVDPAAVLRRLHGWLAPGGLLVLAVPDFGGWWARLSGAHWPFLTPKEHLHYFTRRTLRAALHATGFSVLEIGLAGTPVSYGTLARRLGVERALGRFANAGSSLPFGTLFALARPANSPVRSQVNSLQLTGSRSASTADAHP